MAFVTNNTQQLSLNDSIFQLTEREKRFLDKSWAKVFAEKVFPAIKEDAFSVLYSQKASRPNTPVNVIIGALILKEYLRNTDEEVLEGLMFDIRYQYALHTTSFEEQPLSDRTLSRFRARCLAYETETGIDLLHNCITGLAKELAELMNITPDMQRMDSVMVAANIKKLSRLELFYTCVSNLAKVMVKHGKELSDELKHYIEKDDMNQFIYHRRNEDTVERTNIVMHDGEKMIQLCDGDFDDTSEYQLLIRLFNEQTIFDDDNTRRLRNKEEWKETSKFLRNPSDPDATFRRKVKDHIGYAGNIVESVGEKGSIITDYAYEQNIYSDSQFLKDYLAEQPVHEKTVMLVTDGGYSGEHNTEEAARHGIKLITTNFTTEKPAEIYTKFIFSDDKKSLLKCGNSKIPIYTHYNSHTEVCSAKFELNDCMTCPHQKVCKPRIKTKCVWKDVSYKIVNRAKMAIYMETDEFKELAHFRSGVESIPSILRRKYHVDKIPAHGKERTRLYFGFKIGAINLQKLLDYYSSIEEYAQNKNTA